MTEQAMKHSLQLRTSQQLTLTPQLQQAIRLLQLSTQDVQQEVARMLDGESDAGIGRGIRASRIRDGCGHQPGSRAAADERSSDEQGSDGRVREDFGIEAARLESRDRAAVPMMRMNPGRNIQPEN